MKFTKEQVLENIKAKLANSQKLTDRTILETVEPLLSFANEETELNDFVAKVYPSVDSANRNLIKEQTDFVKNYKPEITQTPTPTITPTPAPLDMEALAKLIADSNKSQLEAFQTTITDLKDKVQSFETQKTVSEITNGGWAKHQGSNPYTELEAFANIAKEQTDAVATTFKSTDEWYSAFTERYNKFATASGREGGYRPVDSTGNVVPEKSAFAQNVEALIAAEKESSQESVAKRLGLA